MEWPQQNPHHSHKRIDNHGIAPVQRRAKARRPVLNPAFPCCEYPKGPESFMTINTPGRGTTDPRVLSKYRGPSLAHGLAKRELGLRKRGVAGGFEPITIRVVSCPPFHRSGHQWSAIRWHLLECERALHRVCIRAPQAAPTWRGSVCGYADSSGASNLTGSRHWRTHSTRPGAP